MIIVLLVISIVILLYIINQKDYELFNDQVGTLCLSCDKKTLNQCTQCFNCGYIVDQFGNGKCIGGDHNGPFNNEKYALWYYGDPWSRMLYNNKHYLNTYGKTPKAANRVIGINPCE